MDCFQKSYYIVLYYLELVDAVDVEPGVWRADCKVICESSTVPGWCPNPPGFQGSIVLVFLFFDRIHSNLASGTGSHFKIHSLIMHIHPLQPKEGT